MKKLFFMLAAFVMLAACSKDDVTNGFGHKDHNNPDEPMDKKVLVISDVHLSDQRAVDGGWAWFNERRSQFIAFLHSVASKSDEIGTLVVAGDLFDEWVAPMYVSPYQNLNGEEVRTESEHFQVLVRDNADVLDAFRQVRNAGIELVYVPGNHDLTCTKEDFDTYLPGLFTQARDAFGVGRYTPKGMPEVVIEHGHRYVDKRKLG